MSSSTSTMLRQLRLDSYLNLPQHRNRTRPGLLDLPPNIRFHIYFYHNLVRDGHVHLNVKELEEDTSYKPTPTGVCRCDSCKTGHTKYNDWSCESLSLIPLLLVCRTLYHDVCNVLYGRNHFVISRISPGGLMGVFNLGATALGSLTSLTISLNESKAACQDRGPEGCSHDCEECVEGMRDTTPTLLSCVSRHDKSIIREWSNLCEHIARFITPSRLRLCLVCDVADFETAQRITQPMLNLPILLACSIRFSTNSNVGLRSLARTTACRLTGRSRPSSSPPLLPHLPYEIQAQILQHTDLVAPYDLQWAPGHGLICRSRTPNQHLTNYRERRQRESNPCELCFGIHKPCSETKPWPKQAALHSECWCWRFPSEFFLVNSEYHRVATLTFYSSNHFYVMPYDDYTHSPGDMWKSPPFVRQLPLNAIRFLRSLQFVIPDLVDWLKPGTQPARDWAEGIDIMAQHATLSQLRITIDQSLSRANYDSYSGMQAGRETDTMAWRRDQRILEPLLKLRGLKDVYVYLDHPMYIQDAKSVRMEREKVLERRVMAPEYDSATRGKYANRSRFFHSYFYEDYDSL